MSAVREVLPFSVAKLLQVWIIVLVSGPAMPGQNWAPPTSRDYDRSLAPSFGDILDSDVYATAGDILVLPCIVKNLGNKVVSWIRSKDLQILTSGQFTFTGDRRFESMHSDDSKDSWGLRIRNAHVSDTGRYECQVNTEPKMSLAISLTVTAPGDRNMEVAASKWVSQAQIKGPAALYVQNGSPATFTCEISPLSPQSGTFLASIPPVRWLRDGKEVSFEFKGRNVSVETRRDARKIISRFRLPSATWSDSGQYTCIQPSGKPATVRLVVVEGEHSEAMQRDSPTFSNGKDISVDVVMYIIPIFTIKFVQM